MGRKQRAKRAARAARQRAKAAPSSGPDTRGDGTSSPIAAFFAPQPIERLELLRIVVPLAILGFLSQRLLHADHWLGVAGFQVPDLGGIWSQPLYLPPLEVWQAWTVAGLLLVSGLMTSLGAYTRIAATVFSAGLVYAALADRLAAFTVSKLGPVLVLGLACTAAGARYSVDAWRRSRRAGSPPPPGPGFVTWGQVRFFQCLLVAFYCASGIAKMNGHWLEHPHVIYTHLHGSYQTGFAHFMAQATPGWAWTSAQGATLVFEAGAPLLLFWPRTRPYALAFGVAMHLLIGLMFGPVIWFSLMMIGLLLGCFAPPSWLRVAAERVRGQLTRA